jgi:hypothetical protein
MVANTASLLIQVDTTFDLPLGSLELYPQCQDYANYLLTLTLGSGSLFGKDKYIYLADFRTKASPELYLIVQILIGEPITLKKSDIPIIKAVIVNLQKTNQLPFVQLYLGNIVTFIERYSRVKLTNAGVLQTNFIGFNVYTIKQMY